MTGKEREIPVEELDFGILRHLYSFLYTWCASIIKFHICKENWVSFMTESRNYIVGYRHIDPPSWRLSEYGNPKRKKYPVKRSGIKSGLPESRQLY